MKCTKCAAELSSGTKFCSYCGHKIEEKETAVTPPPITEDGKTDTTDYSALPINLKPNKNKHEKSFLEKSKDKISEIRNATESFSKNISQKEDNAHSIAKDNKTTVTDYGEVQSDLNANKSKNSFAEKGKQKFLEFWNILDFFSKVISVVIAVVALIMIVAIISGKAFAIFISILQIAGAVVALLIHRGTIKLNEKQKFVSPLILSITILLTLLNLWSFSWNDIGSHESLIPSVSNTVPSNAFSPFSVSDCYEKNYMDIESAFRDAGFANIKTEPIEELLFKDADKLDTIESISVNGNATFNKDQQFTNTDEVVIKYYDYKKCEVTLLVDFIPNLIFSKYDVVIEVDGIEQGTMPHGEDGNFELQLYPGDHTITFINDESSSVSGETDLTIKGDTNVELKISCTSSEVSVETIYIEDMGSVAENEVMITSELIESKSSNYETAQQMLATMGFTSIALSPQYDVSPNSEELGKVIEIIIDGKSDYERGFIFANDVAITISYHASEEDDPVKIQAQEAATALETVFPKEIARRVAVVAMTNRSAPDVFTSDGSSYDPSKFHSYSDLSGFYMSVHSDGDWSAVNENTWHVENLKLKMSEGVYVNASLDITFDGTNYAVIGGDIIIATLENLDSNDPNKVAEEKVMANDFSTYLVVPPSLIEKDRDTSIIEAHEEKEAQEKREQEQHDSWISSQFSLWDGAHNDLEDLIKDNLNDEKSYDHIETNYIEVSSDETKDMVNGILSDAGYSNRVEINDLFITSEFSAENAFGGTIKSTAFGIASYSNNSTTLIAIE